MRRNSKDTELAQVRSQLKESQVTIEQLRAEAGELSKQIALGQKMFASAQEKLTQLDIEVKRFKD